MYLSFLIGGSIAAEPDKSLYLGVLLAVGLGLLGAGAWLIRIGAAARGNAMAP